MLLIDHKYLQLNRLLTTCLGMMCSGLLSLSLNGCDRSIPPGEDVIARVKDRSLTSSELLIWEASLRQKSVPEDARRAFVKSWVDDEVVYAAAIESGLMLDEWVIERFDEIKKKLLMARYLELKTLNVPEPTPSAIRDYYQNHENEFTLENPRYRVHYWCGMTDKEMVELRNAASKSNVELSKFLNASEIDSGSIIIDDPAIVHPEIGKVITSLKPGQLSGVQLVEQQYWVFKLLDVRNKGEKQTLEDVRDIITHRLREENRNRIRENLIRNLVDDYRRTGKLIWNDPPPSTEWDIEGEKVPQ